MEKAEKRLQAIVRKARHCGINPETLSQLPVVKHTSGGKKKPCGSYLPIIALVLLAFGGFSLKTRNSECLLEMPVDSSKVFREAEDCNMCRNVKAVEKVTNISPELFGALYASTAKPVVVSDGTRGWSAVTTFNFDYFKQLYTNKSTNRPECQFFPYKTEFNSLRGALDMDPKRAQLSPGTASWYIGWSNCNDEAGKELRRHYDRPYFLPATSENIALSWIFMGGPGPGAHLHVDNVHYPSWQAQLRGRKAWRLAPPPECHYVCGEFEVIVEPGEIIVVDTNRWYHQTRILPGDISITIGSEFD